MELLEARVKAALERAGYTGDANLLVVAVSGGADSLALLHSLVCLRETSDLRLHMAHLDHNFREEAKEDARFVTQVAGQLGLPATVEHADPMAYMKEMGISSFEEAAREVRYEFLARVARDTGAVAVALGHTADDLAETVLMHIIRGSGVHGLRGMEEVSRWEGRSGGQGAILFRPLLEVSKREAEAYCRGRGIAFREDPGNRLLRFTRNRVRHQLLPSLEEYNPKVREALVRLAHSASLEVDFLEKEIDRAWPTVTSEEGGAIALDSRLLASLHPIIQRLVIRRAYERLAGNTRRLEETHLKAAAQLIGAPAGRTIALPKGLHLHSGYGQLFMGTETAAHCPFPALDGEHQLRLPDTGDQTITKVSGWSVTTGPPGPSDAAGEPFAGCLDLEAIGERLWVRARRSGDRFQPLGMEAEKKLQDFYVDEKVPRAWRDRIPLVVSERGIAWVVGYRVAQWARAREGSRQAFQISFSPL